MSLHECQSCNFVPDKDYIYTYNVPEEKKSQAGHSPDFVGIFTMAGWSGHSAFYLFRCQGCFENTVDYPHGYTNGGFLYLRCHACDFRLVLDSKSHRHIYKREGMPAPPSFWQQLKIAWQYRRALKASRKAMAEQVAQIEDQGIRVVVNNDKT